MRIAISPDENPGDSGSVAADGTPERDVNLRVCVPLLAALKRCNQDVWFDPTITYFDRVSRANSDGTTLLVACAHDVSTPGVSGGCAVFCPGGQSFGNQARAADAIFAELLSQGLTSRRRADVVENIYECCAFDGDTAYIELNCMSVDDEPRWSAPDYGRRAAEAMARALGGVYGFAYVPPAAPGPSPTPKPAPGPTPTQAGAHWWGPYVSGADQVVELMMPCQAPVWQPGRGHWYRNTTIIGTPQAGEFAQWTLANRVGGTWYVMDESGGPQGEGPMGRLPVDQSYWIDDSVTDSSGCGGTNPPAVALTGRGHWYSI